VSCVSMEAKGLFNQLIGTAGALVCLHQYLIQCTSHNLSTCAADISCARHFLDSRSQPESTCHALCFTLCIVKVHAPPLCERILPEETPG
jgi:hypothetical protein